METFEKTLLRKLASAEGKLEETRIDLRPFMQIKNAYAK